MQKLPVSVKHNLAPHLYDEEGALIVTADSTAADLGRNVDANSTDVEIDGDDDLMNDI